MPVIVFLWFPRVRRYSALGFWFYIRYKLSSAAYLSIPALISGLHKMPQILDLSFHVKLLLEGESYIHCGESSFFREQLWGVSLVKSKSH